MKIHVVKKRETLRDIAQRYAVGEAELINANQLAGPGRLCPGQSLFIPGALPSGLGSIEVLAFISRPPAAERLQEGLPYFTYACQYSHSFSPAGEMLPPEPGPPVSGLRGGGCAPLLCLSNMDESGGFSPRLAHLLFTESEVRAALMDALFTKLAAGSYYGVHLSFNYLFPFDRDNYSSFVSELSELLHARGFMLSVELAPREGAGMGSALSAGQDYSALGKAADRLSLMFCRWAHAYSPPQALAPVMPLREALRHAAANIPPEKLLLGISGAGFDWRLPWRQGDEARPISNARAMELAVSLGAEIKLDSASDSPWFLYSDAEEKRHIVFFEDARSLRSKLQLLDEFSLAGISLYTADRPLRPALHVMESLYSVEKLL